jgi:hypothetical protein
MIGQYLPQTNKNITVAKFKKFHELNQAFENRHFHEVGLSQRS